MRQTGAGPVLDMVERLGTGVDALWAVLHAAQRDALGLALLTPMDEDRPFTAVAVQLTDAIGELEWAHPELADSSPGLTTAGTAVGDSPAEGDVLAELLRIGVQVAAGMLRDLPEGSTTTEVVALARVVTLLGDAHLHLTGQSL